MSKDGYSHEAPPSYNDSLNNPPQNPTYNPGVASNGYYPLQSTPSNAYPAPQAAPNNGYYPAQTAYPQQQGGYPQQKTAPPPQPAQMPVAAPDQVIIQAQSGNRQVIVSSNTTAGPTGTVVIQAPRSTTVHTGANTTPYPVSMSCPYCLTHMSSRLNHVQGHQNWVAAGVLCFFGLWICAPFPLCMDSCSDVEHYCPSCNRFLGKYHRLNC